MLAAAVAAAKQAGAEAVVHCGDLIGAMTLRPLIQLGLPVHVVHGNNLGDPIAMWNLCRSSGGMITYHGPDIDMQMGDAGCSPHTIRTMGAAWPAPATTTSCAAAIRMLPAWCNSRP